MINGKCYLDGEEKLEILEIEFFPPKENNSVDTEKFGSKVNDILNSEIDSIRKIGENIREKRKNGDFIPSNKEMIRRSKYLNANTKDTNENEISKEEQAKVQSELDSIRNM